jgi:translation initiation factor eIF-2B subunit beta
MGKRIFLKFFMDVIGFLNLGIMIKVVVGVHAVMASGGVTGPVWLNMVALAARKHAVPFFVVAGTHKVC